MIVDAYDLVDPSDKRGDLNVNSRDIRSSAAEAPRYQTGDLVKAVRLTD